MGASNVPINARTLFTPFEEAARASFGPETSILGRSVPSGDLGLLAASALIAGIATILMVLFLKTELGAAMRATGDNARMLRALGTAITARLLRDGADPVTATLAGMAGGALAGAITGTIHVRFKVNALLSGILVMTALYSVNLRIMGASNVPINARTLFTPFEEAARASFGPETSILGRS
ncbi:MAG: hypothetical protein NT059_12415, partial [Planctomycetota bacterium]|nr:hypothetical protein [Planctomycetota bacterium]